MPSVKDFEKKHKNSKGPKAAHSSHEGQSEDLLREGVASAKAGKRRPGRDEVIKDEVKVVDVETGQHINADSSPEHSVGSLAEAPVEARSEAHTTADPLKKIEISFPGAQLLKSKFPKPFEVAEAVATDWVHDGRFEGLPIGHPLAQFFAAKGLQAAKELEKKIANSPLTEKIAYKAFEVGIKAQVKVNELKMKIEEARAKVSKKNKTS